MASKTIEGWSVSREMDGDEPVWYLSKDGRTNTVRGQAGISDEGMIEAATASVARSNLTFAQEAGDDEAAAQAQRTIDALEIERKINRLRRQAAVLRESLNRDKE